MKKQQNKSTRAWALHVALAAALLSISAVLLASSFKAVPVTRGLSAPTMPVAAGDKDMLIAGPASSRNVSSVDTPFTFSNTGSLITARYVQTATLLPNGKVLVAGGTVTPASEWKNSGATVSITARPSSGYSFDSWAGVGTGSYSGTANPVPITMNGPITETASFAQNPVQVTVRTNPRRSRVHG